MRNVKIITDSCADLGGDLLEQYNIDYCEMSVIEDGAVSPARLTWTREEAHQLYDTIRGGKRITTAQTTAETFHDTFAKYLDVDCDVVYIGCSSKQSGSVHTAQVVADKLMPNYPDAKLYCIDSLNASLGEGMLAVEAAKLAKAGKNATEIYEHIIAVRKTVQQFATVHTLEHLRKAGRVSASSAFFGNLMGVKPILISDRNGTQTPIKKVRGRQNSVKEIVSQLKENITDPETKTIYVGHADCDMTEVDALVALVKQEIPCRDVYVGMIGPIIGASVGPDTLAVWAFGKPVTYEVNEC